VKRTIVVTLLDEWITSFLVKTVAEMSEPDSPNAMISEPFYDDEDHKDMVKQVASGEYLDSDIIDQIQNFILQPNLLHAALTDLYDAGIGKERLTEVLARTFELYSNRSYARSLTKAEKIVARVA